MVGAEQAPFSRDGHHAWLPRLPRGEKIGKPCVVQSAESEERSEAVVNNCIFPPNRERDQQPTVAEAYGFASMWAKAAERRSPQENLQGQTVDPNTVLLRCNIFQTFRGWGLRHLLFLGHFCTIVHPDCYHTMHYQITKRAIATIKPLGAASSMCPKRDHPNSFSV